MAAAGLHPPALTRNHSQFARPIAAARRRGGALSGRNQRNAGVWDVTPGGMVLADPRHLNMISDRTRTSDGNWQEPARGVIGAA
jgi:hypothetical protein